MCYAFVLFCSVHRRQSIKRCSANVLEHTNGIHVDPSELWIVCCVWAMHSMQWNSKNMNHTKHYKRDRYIHV